MVPKTLEELLVQYSEVEVTYQTLHTIVGDDEAARLELEHASRYDLPSEKREFFVPVRLGFTENRAVVVVQRDAGRTLLLTETYDTSKVIHRSYSIANA